MDANVFARDPGRWAVPRRLCSSVQMGPRGQGSNPGRATAECGLQPRRVVHIWGVVSPRIRMGSVSCDLPLFALLRPLLVDFSARGLPAKSNA